MLAGWSLEALGFMETPSVQGFFVKEAVLPFKKFPGANYRLGPEMKSTGEVMGHAARFGHAFAKAQMAAGTPLPLGARAHDDSRTMRSAAIMRGVTLLTTLSAAAAAVNGIAALKAKELSVRSLQEHYRRMRPGGGEY